MKVFSKDSYALLMALRCGYTEVDGAYLVSYDNWLTRLFWQKYVDWHPKIRDSVACLLRQIEQVESEKLKGWLEISKEKAKG